MTENIALNSDRQLVPPRRQYGRLAQQFHENSASESSDAIRG